MHNITTILCHKVCGGRNLFAHMH